jgi:predicted O-methyltransferase YrrM
MSASAATYAAIADTLPTLDGWCTVEKASHLADLVVDRRALRCVEIGVFGGRSLIAMAIAQRELGGGVCWGVDPWSVDASLEGENAPENDEWWSALDYETIYRRFAEAVIRTGVLPSCNWLRMKSLTASRIFDDATIDLLHIDGNHSEYTSVGDVVTWLPKLAPGAIVVVDDADWPTTATAQRLLREHADTFLDCDNYAVFTLPTDARLADRC